MNGLYVWDVRRRLSQARLIGAAGLALSVDLSILCNLLRDDMRSDCRIDRRTDAAIAFMVSDDGSVACGRAKF